MLKIQDLSKKHRGGKIVRNRPNVNSELSLGIRIMENLFLLCFPI